MITVENLGYTYRKRKEPALSNLNFGVEGGEIFGFLGPSGAGKSTAQKILTGLLGEFTGNVAIAGKSIKEWDYSFYDKIGVCFELPNHYLKLTALENLDYFSTFYNVPTKNPIELLEMVGLENDASKRVEEFSKGMKMRLNFVRSLLHGPEILFLDEPTSGLDPVNARNIKNIILDQKKQGKTIFLTTHNMHDADELCDRVAFIAGGRISIIDSPKQLRINNGKRTVKVEYLNDVPEQKEFDMENIGHNSGFLDILKHNHLISIHSAEATLDDVFIEITGTSLNQKAEGHE